MGACDCWFRCVETQHRIEAVSDKAQSGLGKVELDTDFAIDPPEALGRDPTGERVFEHDLRRIGQAVPAIEPSTAKGDVANQAAAILVSGHDREFHVAVRGVTTPFPPVVRGRAR